MKIKNKIKDNRGFTLIELLAVITILAIVTSIAIYISFDVVKEAKERSYQVTKANIEKNAGTFVKENADKVTYVGYTSDTEYQCVTVENLVENGYLSSKVTDSKVSDDKKVSLGDYIFIERNKKSKAIIKNQYTNEEINNCKLSANSEIIFSVSPDNNKWSRSKTVTITYKMVNYTPETTHKYTHTVNNLETNAVTSNSDNNPSPKTLNINKPSSITAKIIIDGETDSESTLSISKIDIVGPTIVFDPTVKGNYNGSVKIPIKIEDTQSGLDKRTVEKEDFVITIGGEAPQKYTLKELTNNPNYNYELEIIDDIHLGDVVITVEKGKILDNVENENKLTENKNKIKMNAIAKYVVNHYIRNLTDSKYTLESTEEKEGTPESSLVIKNLKKTIAGFTYDVAYITGNTNKPSEGALTTTTILKNGTRVINLYYRRNRLYIEYNANGGVQATTHGSKYGIDGNGDFYQLNSAGTKVYKFVKGVYGGKVGNIDLNGNSSSAKSGLDDYNSNNTYNAEKTGYIGKKEAEWNTKTDGKGTSFNQEVITYDADGFAGADLSSGDATVKLYVNWVEASQGTCTLVFNKNLQEAASYLFKDPNPTTKTINVGEKYGELATIEATQEGLAPGTAALGQTYITFVAWYNKATNGKVVEPTTKCTTAGTIQLYAHWATGKIKIEINPCEVNPTICSNPCIDNPAACNPCLASAAAAETCMEANSKAWWDAKAIGDEDAMKKLHEDNEMLSKIAKEGLEYNPSDGYWYDGDEIFYDIHAE